MTPEFDFAGPKTIEAEIEVFEPSEKSTTFSAGFTFVTQGHPERANWVFFSKFRRTMQIACVGKQTIVELTNHHSGKRKLRVNITDGYTEVFVDDEFVLALDDPSIEPGNLFLLGQRFDHASLGKVRYSNLRVRQWDVGRCPLGIDNPDEATTPDTIAWFEKALEKYPDQPYYIYRIAVAHFNNSEFEEAAEYAAKARALGYTASKTGLLTGYVHELAGDYPNAMECYLDNEVSDYQRDYPHVRKMEDVSTPEKLADHFYYWLLTTAPGAIAKERDIPHSFRASGTHAWAWHRIEAAKYAYVGNFGQAESTLNDAVNRIDRDNIKLSEEMMTEIKSQLAAYAENKIWTRNPESKPFYHDLDIYVNLGFPIHPEPFVRH